MAKKFLKVSDIYYTNKSLCVKGTVLTRGKDGHAVSYPTRRYFPKGKYSDKDLKRIFGDIRQGKKTSELKLRVK